MSLDDLTRRAADAAPAAPAGEHLSDDAIGRLRADDERDEDAAAFRHLASCARCRARLVETEPVPIPIGPTAKVIPLRRLWPLLAAAAALIVVATSLLRPPRVRPLEVSTRPFAGMMGSSSASNVAPEDLNLEISFPAGAFEAATLIVGDVRISFTRDGDRMRAAIAPRLFPPNTTGVVIAGNATELAAVAAAPDLEGEAARRGVAVARVKIR